MKKKLPYRENTAEDENEKHRGMCVQHGVMNEEGMY